MPIYSGGGGGGTTYTPPTAREQVFGNNVNIANGGIGALTWDHSVGSALLDFTDLSVPTIITAGIYSVVVNVNATAALTVNGFFETTLDLNLSGDDATLQHVTSPAQTAAARAVSVVLGATWYLPVGADIKVTVQSLDGAAARNFLLNNAVVQRVT